MASLPLFLFFFLVKSITNRLIGAQCVKHLAHTYTHTLGLNLPSNEESEGVEVRKLILPNGAHDWITIDSNDHHRHHHHREKEGLLILIYWLPQRCNTHTHGCTFLMSGHRPVPTPKAGRTRSLPPIALSWRKFFPSQDVDPIFTARPSLSRPCVCVLSNFDRRDNLITSGAGNHATWAIARPMANCLSISRSKLCHALHYMTKG